MNRFRVVKYIAYAVEAVLVFVLQTTPYLLPEVFGGKGIILLPLAVSIAVFEPDIPAMIFAVVCGFLADCSYSGAVGFYTIMLVIMCFIVSTLTKNYIRTNLLTTMLAAFIGIPLIIFLQFVFYYLLAGYTDGWSFFVRHYIPRIIYTLAFMPVMYGLNSVINKRLGDT